MEHSFLAWIKADGCQKAPVISKIPDKAKDGTTISQKTYGSGKSGAEVVLIEIGSCLDLITRL